MLGYSDSCKDGGILASSFGLYEAQQEIIEISKKFGIECKIFHGRVEQSEEEEVQHITQY